MATLDSVNVGRPEPNPWKPVASTGIDKRPQEGPVALRDPGPRTTGLGSGLIGDFVGDVAHHGGADQAVYAYAREDLDTWGRVLGRTLPDGVFGENLTTTGINLTGALIGERWRVGAGVVLVVTCPRIPCNTFRGWVGGRDWLKVFTRAARPGAYLRVVTPGSIAAGDAVEIVHRPDHDVTVALTYRAITTERELLGRLLAAGDDLIEELRETVAGGRTLDLDEP